MNSLKEDFDKPIPDIERRWLRLGAKWLIMLPCSIIAIPAIVVTNAVFDLCRQVCMLIDALK